MRTLHSRAGLIALPLAAALLITGCSTIRSAGQRAGEFVTRDRGNAETVSRGGLQPLPPFQGSGQVTAAPVQQPQVFSAPVQPVVNAPVNLQPINTQPFSAPITQVPPVTRVTPEFGQTGSLAADYLRSQSIPTRRPVIRQPLAPQPVARIPNSAFERFQQVQQQSRADIQNNPVTPPASLPPRFASQPWQDQIRLYGPGTRAFYTSQFGWRQLNGRLDFHDGLDTAAPAGTNILTPVGGTVAVARFNGANSEVVLRRDGLLFTFQYAEPIGGISPGTVVQPGQVIGRQSSRDHLHFAVHLSQTGSLQDRRTENAISPLFLFQRTGLR